MSGIPFAATRHHRLILMSVRSNGKGSIMWHDRRRYPRVAAALDLTLIEASGSRWPAKTVDLSPYSTKVTLPPNWPKLPTGTILQLRLTVPGQDLPLSLGARVVRTDPDRLVLGFVDLGAIQAPCLRQFVDTLLQSLSRGTAPSEVTRKDRRKNPRVDAELDIELEGEQLSGWRRSKTVNLSVSGVKVAMPQRAILPPWGTAVSVRLAGRNNHPPIFVKGIVWRREPQSIALLFVDLDQKELDRLNALIESLQA